MKPLLSIIVGCLFAFSSMAQTKPKQKAPTQKEMEAMMKEARKIEGISITLEFRDQHGNLHPTLGQKTITFSNASGFLNGYFERKMICTTDWYFNPLTAQITQ